MRNGVTLPTFLKYNHELYVVWLAPTGVHPSFYFLSSLYSRVCYGPPGPYFTVISVMVLVLYWRQKCQLLVGMMNASSETHQHTLHMVCWRTRRSVWMDDGLGISQGSILSVWLVFDCVKMNTGCISNVVWEMAGILSRGRVNQVYVRNGWADIYQTKTNASEHAASDVRPNITDRKQDEFRCRWNIDSSSFSTDPSKLPNMLPSLNFE